ncbi:hypothetical protein [Actinokineospora iranica]|uniref:Uncharacterized protein n=1 Tax=Actinokineospora iranica TaxID=1271860 RepID=A0A1G6KEC7_9PSEU|nr:hypothetical protein [Actinokineospora iranica]SDC29439.1 hypothetical protein SAMN05216174_101873 [Actinokineospora iranica]
MVLLIVLLLVLAAFGLLIAALTTANTLWAWVSVVISLVAAAILLLDWLGNRRRAAAAEAAKPDEPEPPTAVEPPAPTPVAPEEPVSADPADEPAEEATDAADLLVISELTADVRVLDERPRYHLTGCNWLAGRQSLILPVSEARQLGFTPCGLCTPDAVLAAKHRESRAAKQPRPGAS